MSICNNKGKLKKKLVYGMAGNSVFLSLEIVYRIHYGYYKLLLGAASLKIIHE